MTKHCFNYCPIDWYEDELLSRGVSIAQITAKLGLDGIEHFVYSLKPPPKLYKELTVGAHLSYWPCWMGFWLQDEKRLARQFSRDQQYTELKDLPKYYTGATTPQQWLEVIRANIAASLATEPGYLVWHVSDAGDWEAFTYKFQYQDREVLENAAAVFNAVADVVPEGIPVLFENLWWPGLRLVDAAMVRYFFSLLNRRDVGIALDTGHLMNTNPYLRNEAEAADYVCRVVEGLGEFAGMIKAVHLSLSLSGEYQRTFPRRVPHRITGEVLWRQIINIDQHRPFETRAAKRILDFLSPEYVNHELVYDSLEDMERKLFKQLSVCF